MAKGKQSPRQRMVNLMYLVFIAMIAIQVSQEVIKSFYETQYSLVQAKKITQQKNVLFYDNLKLKADSQPAKFGQLYQKANQLREHSKTLSSFLEELRTEIEQLAEFTETEELNISALSSAEASTLLFFNEGNEGNPSEKGLTLVKELNDYRAFIHQILGDDASKSTVFESVLKRVDSDFDTKEITSSGLTRPWLVAKFYNQPVVAAIANLEVLASELSNVESDVLSKMLEEKLDDVSFSAYEAVVAAPKVMLQGDKAEAKIFLGSFDSELDISVSGADKVENGQGIKALSTNSVGLHKIDGAVSFKDSRGNMQSFPYTFEYNVVGLPTGGLVSADKMNILYRGVENPVSASITGADASTISLDAPGCQILPQGKGKWHIKPGTGTEVVLTVRGKLPNGKVVSTPFSYRIKNVPAPQGEIRGKNVIDLPASSVPNQTVAASIPDFEFPVKFKVKSFKVKISGKPTLLVTGSSLRQAEGLIRSLRSGDILTIFDIEVDAEGLGDQRVKRVSPVIVNIQ